MASLPLPGVSSPSPFPKRIVPVHEHGDEEKDLDPDLDLDPLEEKIGSERAEASTLRKSAEEKFHTLQKLLQEGLSYHDPNPSSSPSFEKGEEDEEMSLYRKSILPRVSVFAIDALALGLRTFDDEALKVVAVGNISTENYMEIFWEIVRAQEDEDGDNGKGRMVMFEVDKLGSTEQRVLVSFLGQDFEIIYMRCDGLIREYPEIITAPSSFLSDPSNGIPSSIQCRIQHLQQIPSLLKHLDEHPSKREAHWWIKRWVSLPGCRVPMNNQDIFKRLQSLTLNPDASNFKRLQGAFSHNEEDAEKPNCPELLHRFINSGSPRPLSQQRGIWSKQHPQMSMHAWENRLDYIRERNFCFGGYIKVEVTYSGFSDIKGEEWLAMVRRRLSSLAERLHNLVLNTPSTHEFTQRFVHEQASSEDTAYEGFFLIGIDSPEETDEDRASILRLVEKWKEQVSKAPETIEGQCFLEVEYIEGLELEDNIPETCNKRWGRRALSGEEYTSKTKKQEKIYETKTLKKTKGKGNKEKEKDKSPSKRDGEEEKQTKLRTAGDVINRLKYDGGYKIDEWVIGYVDRHTERILEKPAGEWDRETTSEEFIPEHRVEYFKRYGTESGDGMIEKRGRGEIMWQKSTRVDKIFKVVE